jgi:hypothetical protein
MTSTRTRTRTHTKKGRPAETITAVVGGAAAAVALFAGGDPDIAAVLAGVGAVPALVTLAVERSAPVRRLLGKIRAAWEDANER